MSLRNLRNLRIKPFPWPGVALRDVPTRMMPLVLLAGAATISPSPVAAPPAPLSVEECVRHYRACACRASGDGWSCEGWLSVERRVPVAEVLREPAGVVASGP